MINFFFRNLSSSWTRTMSIIITTFISAFIGFVFYFLYINIVSGIEYYTLDGIDERRFSITAGSNIFQLFDREKGGIPDTILQELAKDISIDRYREFRFLDISVLGKFDLFKFSLDIDIPTFSVRDSVNSIQGIGISSQMLKYYNLELAGSHPFFPIFTEADILGRNVSLVFGASKVFSLPEKALNTFTSTITHVDSDYPGFGVVIPFEIAETEMYKLGYEQNNPYKIVGYIKDVSYFPELEKRYSGYTINLDKDKIVKHKKTLEIVGSVLVSIMVSILVILVIIAAIRFTFSVV